MNVIKQHLDHPDAQNSNAEASDLPLVNGQSLFNKPLDTARDKIHYYFSDESLLHLSLSLGSDPEQRQKVMAHYVERIMNDVAPYVDGECVRQLLLHLDFPDNTDSLLDMIYFISKDLSDEYSDWIAELSAYGINVRSEFDSSFTEALQRYLEIRRFAKGNVEKMSKDQLLDLIHKYQLSALNAKELDEMPKEALFDVIVDAYESDGLELSRATEYMVGHLRKDIVKYLMNASDEKGWNLDKLRFEGESLGKGGMGEVFRDGGAAGIAIKRRHDSAEFGDPGLIPGTIFEDPAEIKRLSQISRHPHLVRYYGQLMMQEPVNDFDDEYLEKRFLDVTEEVVGGNHLLSSDEAQIILTTNHDLNPVALEGRVPAIINFLKKLVLALRGLNALHEAGLVHQDFKFENIIENEGWPYVIKLGDYDTLCESGVRSSGAGTFLYMSPEQFNERVVTPKSDVYSVGRSLYHLLGGKTGSGHGVLEDARRGTGTSLHTMHATLRVKQIVQRCTEFQPEKRPDANELIQMLSDAVMELEGKLRMQNAA